MIFRIFLFLTIFLGPSLADDWLTTSTLIDESKYADGFEHYDYVNPEAPVGGTFNSAVLGTYDSFNPFITKGDSAAGLNYFGGLLWDTLMEQSTEEPAVSHPLIAEAYRHPADFSSAIYRLDRRARWHDGRPITASDVKWSMETLKRESPNHTRYFENITEVRILNDYEVEFLFNQKGNRELPNIIGDMPVLPKHWWEGVDAEGNPRDFTRSTLEVPLGNGPYRIGKFEAGNFVEWERVDDYWAWDLPVRRGRYNFANRIYRYFGDENAIWQAFTKGGLADVRTESRAQRWATEYDFPAFESGDVVRRLFDDTSGYSMVGWIMNQRRPFFADRRVREALTLALNFEQMNENQFFDQYTRTKTHFGGTELSATGLPSGRELEILESYRGRIRPQVFEEEFELPVYASRSDERRYLRRALDLLNEAGWMRDGTRLVHEDTKEPFEFEILGYNTSWERIHAPWINSLKKLGITASFRVVDTSQFIERVRDFNFDVIVSGGLQSLSPGNEQRGYWTTSAADSPGSRNYYGLKNEVVDELVDRIISAPSREELVALTRALDRILLFEHLLVPQWYLNKDRVAWWDKFGIPERQPGYIGFDIESWWIDTDKEAILAEKY